MKRSSSPFPIFQYRFLAEGSGSNGFHSAVQDAKADPPLEEFLKGLRLERYLKQLNDEEVTDVHSLRYLHTSDFREMGFSKVEIGRMKEALRKRGQSYSILFLMETKVRRL